MAHIALIACTKSKRATTSRAAQLYTSALFNKSLLYSLTIANRTYILSAKHGLLDLGDVIDPYELSIKNLNANERQEWSSKVGARLRQLLSPKDTVHILTGREYYTPLLQYLKDARCTVSFPLSGLSLGNRISWLRKRNKEEQLQNDYSAFYAALRELYVGQDGGRTFSECTGRLTWPKRGVYLILEPDEFIKEKKLKPLQQRIVRVGKEGISVEVAEQRIFEQDLAAIEGSDLLVAVLDGAHIDEGVAFETGYAFALGKVCVGLQTDGRRALPTGNNPMIGRSITVVCHSRKELIDWIVDFASGARVTLPRPPRSARIALET